MEKYTFSTLLSGPTAGVGLQFLGLEQLVRLDFEHLEEADEGGEAGRPFGPLQPADEKRLNTDPLSQLALGQTGPQTVLSDVGAKVAQRLFHLSIGHRCLVRRGVAQK